MKIKIQDQTVNIPSSWDKVKYKDFAHSQTKGLPLQEKLSYQTGIDVELLTNLQLVQLAKVIELVSFQDTLPEFWDEIEQTGELRNEKGEPLVIGDEHYIKMEQSRLALSNGNHWLAAIDITKDYTGVDISELSVLKGMGYALFFCKGLRLSLKGTKH